MNELGKNNVKIEDREFKKLSQFYSESFLKRLLRLIEIFTSIATCSSRPLSMIQRVINPYYLSSLLHLLLVSSPQLKITVLKILQHIVQIQIPFDVFEEAVRVLTSDNKRWAHKLVHESKVET
jgi:hypothetical protein